MNGGVAEKIPVFARIHGEPREVGVDSRRMDAAGWRA
jgi:hypothetical protein